MRDVLRTIPLLVATLLSPPELMPRAAESVAPVAYALKTPRPVVYLVVPSGLNGQWVPGHERDRPAVRVQFGSRVVLQLADGVALGPALQGIPLKPARELGGGRFILQADSAAEALEQSQRMARRPEVL
ncbi:MAG: hypothetical protein VX509_03250, partial [Verrucomicrobiota bacterium]|nr:hypothetical protein [Verrucomicrobiota bacterium]